MPAEILADQPAHQNPGQQTLNEFLLAILEQHDGLCLDNAQEREALAMILAAALTALDPHLQIDDSSASPPRAE